METMWVAHGVIQLQVPNISPLYCCILATIWVQEETVVSVNNICRDWWCLKVLFLFIYFLSLHH